MSSNNQSSAFCDILQIPGEESVSRPPNFRLREPAKRKRIKHKKP